MTPCKGGGGLGRFYGNSKGQDKLKVNSNVVREPFGRLQRMIRGFQERGCPLSPLGSWRDSHT